MKKSLSIATAAAVAGYRSKSSGTGDPYWSNTSLLLSGDGTNGAQNFTDLTGKNTIQTVGNAQISTSNKKFGTGSMYFDGNGDYITVPFSSDFNFGTGDFTIECWVKRGGVDTSKFYNIFSIGGPSSNSYALYIQDGYIDNVIYGMTLGTFRSSNIDIPANVWTHVASVRVNGVLKTFVNGNLIMSVSAPQSITNDSIKIGGMLWNAYFDNVGGFIDDLRITKGVARYTSNFTVPTKALPAQGI